MKTIGNGKYRNGPKGSSIQETVDTINYDISWSAKRCHSQENNDACSFFQADKEKQEFECLKFHKKLEKKHDDNMWVYIEVCEECKQEFLFTPKTKMEKFINDFLKKELVEK